MQDADVSYLERMELGLSYDDALWRLVGEVPWEQRTIKIWGREHPQPRLVAWYGDPDCAYSYSGIRLNPIPWTDLILSLKNAVESAVDFSFNSALLNFYRNHHDSMGFHSDDEPELGLTPTIASLSLGTERTFMMKHRANRVPPIRLKLAAGSVLLMRGNTQQYWAHGINKQSVPCGPRVNITFRRICR